jgi:hypothetical protein
MVTVFRGSGWKIAVYGHEHGVPHFHIEGPGYRCSVGIASGDVIIANAPNAVLRAALTWALQHCSELMATWQELNG